MADFNISFERVVSKEGGYVNDPDDAGGETYMGISRRANPNPEIWKHIDKVTRKYTKVSDINRELKRNTELTKLIKNLYKTKYWNPFKLDEVANQRLANQIFDNSVNRGVSATKKMLDRVRNEMAIIKK